jgi:hypothetical protein
MTPELPGSPLPDDPTYWNTLAQRIGGDAAAPLARYAARGQKADDRWFGLLSRAAPWLLSAAATATLLLWLALPPRAPDASMRWLEPSIAPHDDTGALIGGSLPPSVDRLMLDFPPAPTEELEP